LRVIAYGDSTTAPRGELVVYADLLRAELPSRGVACEVINAGVGGNTTEDARARFDTDVLAREPDLVVIQFGLNDSAIDVWRGETSPRVTLERYAENLDFFLDALAVRGAAGTRAVLMTPNPMTWTEIMRGYYAKPPYDSADPDGMNVPLMPYVERVRRIARERGVPLADIQRLFREYAARPGRSLDDLLLDGQHPNAEGQRLVADALLPLISAKTVTSQSVL
jgi:lysophospholipase L1-like esterase